MVWQVAYLLADEETVSRELGAYSLDGGMELNAKSGVMFQSGVHRKSYKKPKGFAENCHTSRFFYMNRSRALGAA